MIFEKGVHLYKGWGFALLIVFIFSLMYNEMIYVVAISRQCPFGADKPGQISRAVFLIKGHNPSFDAKSPYKSGHQISFEAPRGDCAPLIPENNAFISPSPCK